HHLTETQIMTGNIKTLLSGWQLASIEDDLCPDLVATNFARCRYEIGQKRLHIHAVNMFARKFRIQTRCIGNIGDQAVKTANVMLDNVKKPFARLLSLSQRQRFNSAAQRGEGVLQLVTDISGKALDGLDTGIKRISHLADGRGKMADFILTFGEIGNFHAAFHTVTNAVGS